MNVTITLKDLSTMSGFSVSTVSKALNDKLDISIETRKTIRSIAKEYNYIPNNFAVALRKKTSKVIAVIVPQVNEPFFSSFLFNIQKRASILGYRLMFFQSFNNYSKENEYLNSINDGSVAGAIVLTFNEFIEEEFVLGFPIEIVSINHLDKEEQSIMYCKKRFNRLLEKI